MVKVTHIEIVDSHTILCVFSTNERRLLDIHKVLDPENRLVKKVLQPATFKQAKIGEFGEILWENAGEIRELDGSVSSCEYDISPEFAYHHSEAC
jgi:hypothetical protein